MGRDDLRINSPRARVIRCLRRGDGLTAPQIAELLRMRPGATYDVLRRLKKACLVRTDRDGRDVRWYLIIVEAE